MVQKLKDSPLFKPVLFILVSIISLALFGKEIPELIRLILHESEYSHLGIVPLITLFFLWSGRKQFLSERGLVLPGTIMVVVGAVYALLLNFVHWNDLVLPLSLKGFGVIMVIYGTFIMFWGFSGFKKVLFPFILLLLAIPFPFSVLDSIIRFLQHGSAVMVDWLFTILGQSFVRDDISFHLDKVSITIAPECSGIRSTMALIITGAVAAEMFLKRPWIKVLMVLFLIPLSLLKNAIRIVTITMLAQYVDMSFLTHSFLHKSGGVIFYLIVLAIYFPVLFILAKLETQNKQTLSVKVEEGN